MKNKLIEIRAKRVVGKYKSYAEFSKHASKDEKKLVMTNTLLQANRIQRRTAGIK